MTRKLSMLAPDWWDYTTLDDEILSDVARSVVVSKSCNNLFFRSNNYGNR